MYAGAGFSDWEIGDVDVFIHDGVYHLFHLIIPNHDYIAHAVSEDGMSWKRVKNALFVGDPGTWDDDMLWTMHVAQVGGEFQMFYTGLRRSDRGKSQKIGLATSRDLIHWRKSEDFGLPLKAADPYYETQLDSPREWASFRDPFYFRFEQDQYLLICARSKEGPPSRRGCVGLAKFENGTFKLKPTLLFPRMYDDIECPCICQMAGRFYLIGSIREDIKVRYWFSNNFRGEYRSFHSDVLLPQGNYAARVVKDGEHLLIYNFYFTDGQVNSLRVLPPPKQLAVDENGRLFLTSFYRWRQMVLGSISQIDFPHPSKILNNATAHLEKNALSWTISATSGYELFLIEKPSASLIWEGHIILEGMGKFGLVLDSDPEGNGYFIPFDLVNGYVTIRSWGFNPQNNRQNFIFTPLQSGLFEKGDGTSLHFIVIRYGHYIELSINGIVKLTLIDYSFTGRHIGLYSASSRITLQDSKIHTLPDPSEEYASQEAVFSEGQ